METTKMSNFTCQSKSFINIFSTCQVSACELQLFSCHNLANDVYSETAKTVFSHLKKTQNWAVPRKRLSWSLAVHHQSLAFRARLCHAKNEAPEEEAEFYAWTHLSNFNQSERKNWTWSVTNTWPWLEKIFPACILKKLAEFLRLRSIWNQNRNSAGQYWHKHNIFDMNLKK